MRHFKRFPNLILIFFACAFSAGCIIFPVPLPKRARNVTGVNMPKHFDIGFIKPGLTRRDEVLRRIDLADTGLQNERLFLARWKVSHTAVCGAVGGYYSAYANCGRVWQARNLMVEFDGHGIVQKVQRVQDRDIGKVLAAWGATDQEPPLDLSKPVHVPVDKGRNSAELALARASLVYQYKAKSMRLRRQQILGVNTIGWKGHSYSIRVEIQYRKGHGETRKLKFRMSPANLLTLIEYLEQTRVQGPPIPAILETDPR
jgi:hypothetical protein